MELQEEEEEKLEVNIDIEDEGLVNGFIRGLQFEDVDVEKSAKAAGENVFFGLVDHVERRLQKNQKKDEVDVFDEDVEENKEKDRDEEACFCPIAFEPKEVCGEGHFVFLIVQLAAKRLKRCARIRR